MSCFLVFRGTERLCEIFIANFLQIFGWYFKRQLTVSGITPEILFKNGANPNFTFLFFTFAKTSGIVLQYILLEFLRNFEAAKSLYVPSGPSKATLGEICPTW